MPKIIKLKKGERAPADAFVIECVRGLRQTEASNKKIRINPVQFDTQLGSVARGAEVYVRGWEHVEKARKSGAAQEFADLQNAVKQAFAKLGVAKKK